MHASQLFGTIIRILNQPVFPARARRAHKARAARRPHVAPDSTGLAPLERDPSARLGVPTGLAPITVTAPSRPAPLAAVAQAAPVAPASAPAMRSLDEVRADLARLRDEAKRRQARIQREQAFAPTDFMEYGTPQVPGKAASQADSSAARAFAPTDFLDIKPS